MFSMIMLCMTLLTISCKSTKSMTELTALQSTSLGSVFDYYLADTLFPLSIDNYPAYSDESDKLQKIPTMLPPMVRHTKITAIKSQVVRTSTKEQEQQTKQSETLPVAAARSLVGTIIAFIVLCFIIVIVFRLLHV